jgi:hypothetical protein
VCGLMLTSSCVQPAVSVVVHLCYILCCILTADLCCHLLQQAAAALATARKEGRPLQGGAAKGKPHSYHMPPQPSCQLQPTYAAHPPTRVSSIHTSEPNL